VSVIAFPIGKQWRDELLRIDADIEKRNIGFLRSTSQTTIIRGLQRNGSLSVVRSRLDSMLTLAYSTVKDDSHFDEAATFRRGFVGAVARTAGRGQGRDWVCVGARPEGQNAGEREAPEGIAPGVLEIVSDFRGDTFRAVYTVKFPKAVYVLRVFQKKSKRGIATPKHEMKLVEKRLAQVVELEKPTRKNLG
jgi:Phage derived protein Gp49-like (DUF891)